MRRRSDRRDVMRKLELLLQGLSAEDILKELLYTNLSSDEADEALDHMLRMWDIDDEEGEDYEDEEDY